MALKHTPLDDLHREIGARMVPFAGYDMPVQYPAGIIAEHQHTRTQASLFDVSHMGQLILEGPAAAATLESLVPADIQALGEHRQCYTLLTNDAGGVRDDLIVTRWGADRFCLVVNAACKAADRAYIQSALTVGQSLTELTGQGLLALQGPAARAVLADLLPGAERLGFLQGGEFALQGHALYLSCSGYTGEDGYELSMAAASAEAIARCLLAHPQVEAAGLGARDSLRLEAGLCLYGHELSAEITPVEAALTWSIAKTRRAGGSRAGGYPGAVRIAEQMDIGPLRRRVGLRVHGRRPVRAGHAVLDLEGRVIGEVSSGGFGATVGAPIAMAFVNTEHSAVDSPLAVDVRGNRISVEVVKLPLVPHRYFRG